MLQRTNKVLIGKDIARSVTQPFDDQGAGGDILDGELVVLDKDMNMLVAGQTIADTDIIYIGLGVTDTYNYITEPGVAVTGTVKVLLSDPIEGAKVRSFRAESALAASEQVLDFPCAGMVPVVGTEYIVRIVYKDMNEHPGQFTHTYRYVSTTAVLATWLTAIIAKINAHSGRRVLASAPGASVLRLTGLAIPECGTRLTDIDEFTMVEFDAFYNYVDANGNWQTFPSTSTVKTLTSAEYGQGTWELERDAEKLAKGYRGNDNKTHFPVLEMDFETVVDETYDAIIIEHDKSYLSPDNQYVKQAPLTTVIFIADNAAGPAANQAGDILADLNPWMASCPGAFANVTV